MWRTYDDTPTASGEAGAVSERSIFSQRLVHHSRGILEEGSCLSGLQVPIDFNSVMCAELMKAVYLPDLEPVELLLCELGISKSDHQDDDVTPLMRGVSLTVSLPKLGGRVTSLTVFVTVCATSVAKIASSAWFVSICEMVMTITGSLACS